VGTQSAVLLYRLQEYIGITLFERFLIKLGRKV